LNEKKIWDYLIDRIGNPCGVAGLMGNLYAESGLNPRNLQNSYERKLGLTDDSYTAGVDSGKYNARSFIHDSAGYGLAQWTYHTRKQKLLNFAKERGSSIGDLDMQLDFLWKELQGYKGMLKTLCEARSVRMASDAVLTQYERPANQSESVKKIRAKYGQRYYDQFYAGNEADGGSTMAEQQIEAVENFETEAECEVPEDCVFTLVNGKLVKMEVPDDEDA